MSKLTVDISTSLDGFVAGPNQTLDQPLGEGGEGLHEWAYKLASWRQSHGRSGGETGADSEIVDEALRSAGATVMGRRMFSGGAGAWEDDPNANGWWGDEPPFRHRCSSSPTMGESRSRCRAGPRSRSSPRESKRRSSRRGRRRARRTSPSPAAARRCSST